MKIAVAQLGARMHYAVPRIFHEAGMLERFFTDSYVGNKPWLEAALRAVPGPVRPRAVERWLGRKEPAIPPEKVTSFELFGLRYARARARARNRRELVRVFAEHARRFNELVLTHGLGDADTVWGFNGASLELFRWAKGRGLRCILEQTMAPHRVYYRLMRREKERWPGWQPGLELLDPDEDPRVVREEEEWGLADLVVCGSEFVVEGIRECGGPAEKCRVVPYGVDIQRYRRNRHAKRDSDGKIRVLFAGEVGLRKGAPYLLEALRELGPARVEARFAGRVVLAPKELERYREVATFMGAVPRSRMSELYAWADVFVLPTVCEGSATVMYEALAAGLLVVCTASAGPPPHPRVTVVDASDPQVLAAGVLDASKRRRGREGQPSRIDLDAYADRLLGAILDRLRCPERTRCPPEVIPDGWLP